MEDAVPWFQPGGTGTGVPGDHRFPAPVVLGAIALDHADAHARDGSDAGRHIFVPLAQQRIDGEISAKPMTPGVVAYVPPYWAHRTVNVGSEPFVFLACFPADAGYDYGTIAERGFGIIVVEREGVPAVTPNPKR